MSVPSVAEITALNDDARYLWIARNILPLEAETRGWLRRHVRSMPDADLEDLIQDAYAALWDAEFPAIHQPRAYWFATVRNLVLERARRARIVPMERLGEIDALSIPGMDPGPERRASARQELEQLLRFVAGLPKQCRQVFELRKFAGLSQREVAARLGIAEKTVENHLTRALARLLRSMTAAESAQSECDASAKTEDEDEDDDRVRRPDSDG